jgi:hypothetical protein
LSPFPLLSHPPPGHHFPEFLLPFRKPKRIRTAFSPNQLLKLEQAFEKNQYVVGQERKELAKALNLSETQVTDFSFVQHLLKANLPTSPSSWKYCLEGCNIKRAHLTSS